VTVVSPIGKAISVPTPGLVQNCTVLVLATKLSTCINASRVQARLVLVRASNRQVRSLTALLFACDPPKGRVAAGTPPMFGEGPASQTLVLPLPSARDTISWRSGRILELLGSDLNVTVPTGRPLIPGLASR